MCSTRLRIGPRAFALESPPPSCLNNRPYSPEPPSGLDSRRYPEVAIRETWSEPSCRAHISSNAVFGQLTILRKPEITASAAESAA